MADMACWSFFFAFDASVREIVPVVLVTGESGLGSSRGTGTGMAAAGRLEGFADAGGDGRIGDSSLPLSAYLKPVVDEGP